MLKYGKTGDGWMVAEVLSGMIQGIQGELITIQADISEGLPVFGITGHLSSEVKEAKDRVRTALKNTGYRLPPRRVSVNLAPADVRKSGTRCDLAIAVGILVAMGQIPKESVKGIIFLGELALDGVLLSLTGVLAILKTAQEAGYNVCAVPLANVEEASLLPEMTVLGFTNLKETITYLNRSKTEQENRTEYKNAVLFQKEKNNRKSIADTFEGERYPDISEIKGQPMAKRALEIAVAGFHNLFLDGPPGAGKSMLASCTPGLMPKMDKQEMIDTTVIYSVKGMLREGKVLLKNRPFRMPSSSVTMAGMFGGGNNVRPGEVTLAHHGVLFLDEFPEFRREVIEMFRVILEEHQMIQIRNGKNICFPADFILIAAANPCPCGYYPDRRYCQCTPQQILKYQNRLSGPILDRLDLFVHCDKVSYAMLAQENTGESSKVIRERIEQVWNIQKERFIKSNFRFNGRMSGEEVKKYCVLDKESQALMAEVFDEFGLTGRSYTRILKVARTIADLSGSLVIREEHLREALLFRRTIPRLQ